MSEHAATIPVRLADGGPNPLLTLRSATADAHRRLDENLPVTRPDLTEDEYLAFLSRMYGIVEPLEEHVAVHVPLDDWDDRRRAWMLREDLGPVVASAPPCPFTPRPANADEALGAAYVLEGSTLGGLHVTEMVRDRLGPNAPTRWFRSHGEQVPARWQAFRRAVHRHVEDGGDLDAIVAGALATFEAMTAWLLPPTA